MGSPLPYKTPESLPVFTVESASFEDGHTLPPAQTSARLGVAGGKDESPGLAWHGAPEGTKGYAVTVFDPDARSGYWHWAVVGIPAATMSLPAGAGTANSGLLPGGAAQLKNDAGTADYLGAAPPRGSGQHRYVVAVHALDVADLRLTRGMPAPRLGPLLDKHTLARATITGVFERR
ncbi:YbhB/YbcL family Raf kinase inhibitor-like protein [Arthrobacter cupressi]